jgi:oxygen-independent coproporphyrinogen-3 oxidase
VQDFDPRVQQAVHRVQPFEQVRELMKDARELGFESINADLIYGLPKQTPSFNAHHRAGAELRPTASRCTPMRTCRNASSRSGASRADSRPPSVRLHMHADAIATFIAGGYELHRHGPLRAARRRAGAGQAPGPVAPQLPGLQHAARLRPDRLGVSAIGRMGATYSQNAKTIEEYTDALSQGQWPVQRGIALTRDDLLRRAVIMALMCQGRLDFDAVASASPDRPQAVLRPRA